MNKDRDPSFVWYEYGAAAIFAAFPVGVVAARAMGTEYGLSMEVASVVFGLIAIALAADATVAVRSMNSH